MPALRSDCLTGSRQAAIKHGRSKYGHDDNKEEVVEEKEGRRGSRSIGVGQRSIVRFHHQEVEQEEICGLDLRRHICRS
jgi:hypothetical protein